MLLLVASAAFVGFVHSLAPGHWLPVALLAKSRRWPLRKALLAAAVAGSGHILVSNSLGLLAIFGGMAFDHERVEKFGSLLLVVFGAIYAGYAWFTHHRCHGHAHHGPDPRKQRRPFLFLFSLGFSPCAAVVPVFVAAALQGPGPTLAAMGLFSVGVLAALSLAVTASLRGTASFDHPLLEHYGDVITGVSLMITGTAFYWVG